MKQRKIIVTMLKLYNWRQYKKYINNCLLYLIDYTSFNSHTVDPRSVINFPTGKKFTDRYTKY